MNKLYITELVEMPYEKLRAGHRDASRCIEQTLPDLFKPFPSWVGLPQAETVAAGAADGRAGQRLQSSGIFSNWHLL